MVCGFLLALLLAFGKRLPEAAGAGGRAPRYPLSYLHDVVTMLAGVTLVTYTLYTVAPDTTRKLGGSNALLLTVPLVLFGIMRYLLVLHREGAQDPTATLFRDRALLATVVVWIVAAGTIVLVAGCADEEPRRRPAGGGPTVLGDVERLCELAGMKQALAPGATTILKDNISWHYPFPGANTTPWQLEGTILALQHAGLRRPRRASRTRRSSPTPSRART